MLKRQLETPVLRALQNFPVVYVNGPRQAGKSTLVQKLAEGAWPARYASLDEATLLGAAVANPESFLRSFASQPLVIDEVQLAPALFRPLKQLADESRKADKKTANGRFLLTGSANVMALPALADALVGRMSVLTLYPLAARELHKCRHDFLACLLHNDFYALTTARTASQLITMQQATFPEIHESDTATRKQWFENYLTTILQRDVRQIADIAKLGVLPNLLRILATRAGGLLNEADIARALGQNAVTTKNYRLLLQALYLTFDVRPWYRNLGKRLVKAAKGYFVDTSLLCHLLQVDLQSSLQKDPHLFGMVFENFVASELLKQLNMSEISAELFHYRTSDGKEVDFLLEQPNGSIAAIEVKGRDAVTEGDFAGLKHLRAQVGDDFACGVVLYLGNRLVAFDTNLWAVPVAFMWT